MKHSICNTQYMLHSVFRASIYFSLYYPRKGKGLQTLGSTITPKTLQDSCDFNEANRKLVPQTEPIPAVQTDFLLKITGQICM